MLKTLKDGHPDNVNQTAVGKVKTAIYNINTARQHLEDTNTLQLLPEDHATLMDAFEKLEAVRNALADAIGLD